MLGRHYRDTMGHPSSYHAVAIFSLPMEPTNKDADQQDVLNQLQHTLGYPKGVRYDFCGQWEAGMFWCFKEDEKKSFHIRGRMLQKLFQLFLCRLHRGWWRKIWSASGGGNFHEIKGLHWADWANQAPEQRVDYNEQIKQMKYLLTSKISIFGTQV